MATDAAFTTIAWRGRAVGIEHAWVAPERSRAPLLVFLHEGLGSLALWKDFPQQLCGALACRGLVYSRPGHGRSTARAADQPLAPDYMHQQAYEVLPALLQALGVDVAHDKPWLLGHSDGGSIALLYAARFGANTAGAVVLAPHVMVEDVSLTSIARARQAYLAGGLRERLARYHDDPDSVFWGWNDIWLHPSFKGWSIAQDIAAIACPLLAVQGLDDEYGTPAQLHDIARRVPQTSILELAACGHSPQRDQPNALIIAVTTFFQRHTRGNP